MSEEDDDEDEEEGKAAVQPDDKFKINKTGMHGVYLTLDVVSNPEVKHPMTHHSFPPCRRDRFPPDGQREDPGPVLQPGHQGRNQVMT